MQKPLQKSGSLSDRWKGAATLPADIRHEVLRVLGENPRMFDSEAQREETLRSMQALDSKFQETGGTFFHVGKNAFDTAHAFTDIHVERYRQTGRPSLPALAIHHAKHMGLDKDSPAYKALLMVAVRAEMKISAAPEYHSKFHYMDVAAMTANLLEKNAEMVKEKVPGVIPLSKHEQALTFIAAIGHDLDHEGKSNPPGQPFLNEMKSYKLMEPLLQQAGLSEADQNEIKIILMTTSPDGGIRLLKAVALAQRTGTSVDFSEIDPKKKFSELYVLEHKPKLTQRAAVVGDADVYGSTAGLKANQTYSQLFQIEKDKAGEKAYLLSDQARKNFLDYVVGEEGYASFAGRAVAGDTLEALRKGTERRIQIGPKRRASRPAGPPR